MWILECLQTLAGASRYSISSLLQSATMSTGSESFMDELMGRTNVYVRNIGTATTYIFMTFWDFPTLSNDKAVR